MQQVVSYQSGGLRQSSLPLFVVKVKPRPCQVPLEIFDLNVCHFSLRPFPLFNSFGETGVETGLEAGCL